MESEFDPAKSVANLSKHGIDFDAAQALWADPWLLQVPARTEDEPRTLSIGRIDGRHWAAVSTERDGRIRIISVRRARQEEIERYEGT